MLPGGNKPVYLLYTEVIQWMFLETVLNEEVMVAKFIVQHNLPIATADRLAWLFKNVFLYSKIAASYASVKTLLVEHQPLFSECKPSISQVKITLELNEK